MIIRPAISSDFNAFQYFLANESTFEYSASDNALTVENIELFLIKYLQENFDVLNGINQSLKTNLRRVIKIYDWLKYGKNKSVPNTYSESEPKGTRFRHQLERFLFLFFDTCSESES